MELGVGFTAELARQLTVPRHAAILADASPLPPSVQEISLVAAFEQQVARQPDRIAVQSAGETLTYGELNAAANRCAHYLAAAGITPAAPTAVLLERSIATVVSLLAVLKTGGYFLCLEPSLPTARLQDLLARGAVQTAITAAAHLSAVTPALPAGVRLLQLDHVPASGPTHNLDRRLSPSQPMRLGFTSGSTGAPKPNLKVHAGYLYGAWQSSNAYVY